MSQLTDLKGSQHKLTQNTFDNKDASQIQPLNNDIDELIVENHD